MVSIEQHCDWIVDCIAYLNTNNISTIEAQRSAQEHWVQEVNRVANNTMLTTPSCNSWYLGVNIPGKPRVFMPYAGGVGTYREKCDDVAKKGYEGFVLGHPLKGRV